MKICANCKWHEQETVTFGKVCVNTKSKRCTDFTMKYDTCSAWEGHGKVKSYDDIWCLLRRAREKGVAE